MTYVQDLTETDVFIVLRTVILEILGGAASEVIRVPTNRTPMPKVLPFITMYPLMKEQIAWPHTTTVSEQSVLRNKQITQAIQYTIQLDVYGPTAGDIAQTLWGVFQSADAYDLFAAQTPKGVYPISAETPRQVPMIDGESEYEVRWMLTVNLQYNPTLSTTVQTASTVTVQNVINVEATYN